MSQQQCLTDRRRQLTGSRERSIRDTSSKLQREKNKVCLCKNKRNHRNSPAHLTKPEQNIKDSSVKGMFGYCISPFVFLSADASRFPHVHRDLRKQVQLLHLQHPVGQRVYPVFVHRLPGVSDSVEPGNTQTRHTTKFSQGALITSTPRIIASSPHFTTSSMYFPSLYHQFTSSHLQLLSACQADTQVSVSPPEQAPPPVTVHEDMFTSVDWVHSVCLGCVGSCDIFQFLRPAWRCTSL